MKIDKDKTYYCYSIPLDNYIRSHGIKPYSSGIHRRTDKVFYMYQMTEELSEILTEWTENNPNNK